MQQIYTDKSEKETKRSILGLVKCGDENKIWN